MTRRRPAGRLRRNSRTALGLRLMSWSVMPSSDCLRYLPEPSTATLPSASRISPVPSKRRLVSRVMRATQRTSSSRGSGRRKRTLNSTVTPQAPGCSSRIARPMVSSRMVELMPPCSRPG